MPPKNLKGAVYGLAADRTWVAYLSDAKFVGLHRFEFRMPLLLDRWFLPSMKAGGRLTVLQWTLTTYDASLLEIGRDVWQVAQVLRVRIPALGASGEDMPHIFVQMLVGDVSAGDPKKSFSNPSGAGSQKYYGDPLNVSVMQWKIDGVGEVFVSDLAAFNVGQQASDELVFSFGPDSSANMFRDWLRGGNAPRGGSLQLLNSALELRATILFTGLRVRSVVPAMASRRDGRATVRLGFSGVEFPKMK